MSKEQQSQEIPVEEVLEAIRRIQFGSVLIKVHQGRIVGYEVTEKRQI